MFLRFLISLLRLTGRVRRRKNSPIHSFVVVELTRLGDVLTMLPAVRLLASHFTQARASLVADARYCPLLRALQLPVEVYAVERPETFRGFVRAVLLVRRLKPDLALSMSPPKRNTAVTLMSGARCKVGYLTYRDSVTPYLQSTPIEALGCELKTHERYDGENIEERSLKVCRALGIPSDGWLCRLELDERAYRDMRDRLFANGTLPRRPYVVLHPFSGWQFRSWPLEYFVELAEALRTHAADYDVLFLCEGSEAPRLDALRRRLQRHASVHVLASSDLLMTAVVLKDATLVVGNDSGPLHLASALGTRIVGLFGPASPALTGPRGARGEFHYQRVECSPCDQRVCVRPTHWCMKQISVEAVTRSALAQLSAQPLVQAVANA